MTRAGLALLFVVATACGGADAAGDGGAGGDGPSGDGGANVDAIWPGGNSYAHATCPCSFGEACVAGGCVAAPAEYVQVQDQARSLACAYDPGVLAGTFAPGPIVGRCQAMGGEAANPSATITTGNATVTSGAASVTWPGGTGCADAPPVTYTDGADVTIAVTPTETFPAATVTLPTPASAAGALLPTQIVPGEPLAFGWVPAPTVDDTVEIILISSSPTPYVRIRCVDVPDVGAFKIPAELTAMLAGRLDANVAVQRVTREHLSPTTTTPVSIELSLLRSADVTIPILNDDQPPPDATPGAP